MARGIQPSVVQLAEEMRIEAISVGYELVRHDAYELAVFETLVMGMRQVSDQITRGDASGALQTVDGCLAALRQWFDRDRRENARHREIARGWPELNPREGRAAG